MVARSKPHGAATTGVRVTTATRTAGADTGRAGALRLAILSLIVAGLIGAGAYFFAYSSATRDTLDHLETVRQLAARALADTLEDTRQDAAVLADDPRAARALRDSSERPRSSDA